MGIAAGDTLVYSMPITRQAAGQAAVDIHEYQAKRLLKGYGVAVPRGVVAFSPAEAEAAARFLGGQSWAVKAQIHAGGRGAAGGVGVVYATGAVKGAAGGLVGRPLIHRQTGRGE